MPLKGDIRDYRVQNTFLGFRVASKGDIGA